MSRHIGRTASRLTLSALLAVCASPAVAQQSDAERNIDDVVESAMSRSFAPGAVVVIVVRDSIALLRTYGRTSFADDAPPLDADALFRAGALSELLNGLAAAHLAHRGTIELDAPLGTLIPELPRQLRDVTTAQLLSHTSGMAHQEAVAGRGGADDLGAAARGLTRFDRVVPGGAMYSFSNTGISLAGLAIERAAAQPYASAMQQAVLEPLGMHRSTFDFAVAAPALTPGWHRSTSVQARVVPAVFEPDSATTVPRRGFITTARDAGRLAAALLSDGVVEGERVLPEGVVASVLEPRADIPFSTRRSALGVRVGTRGGRPVVSVTGGGLGHSIWMRLLPLERVGVIVLANNSVASFGDVSEFVFRRLIGDVPETPAQEETVSAPGSLEQLAVLTGSWVNGSELIEIVQQDGLPMLRSGDLTLPIRVLDDGSFGALIDNRVALRFRLITDDAGRPLLWLGNRALARQESR